MEFKELSLANMEEVRLWRNQQLHTLRTPYHLTQEMQAEFYKNVVCNRNSNSRWWGIYNDNKTSPSFIGMCGLLNIEWENSLGEISIILKPISQGMKNGTAAVHMLLDRGFNQLNLKTIYGECYESNSAIKFWKKISNTYNAINVYMPNRKYWEGKYYHSLYFSIDKEDFNGTIHT
jgi:RimJ/RimL family protein N-acetyltransferase